MKAESTWKLESLFLNDKENGPKYRKKMRNSFFKKNHL